MNIQYKNILSLAILFAFLLGISGCTGLQTFTNAARAGDTISIIYNVGDGGTRNSSRDNTTIVIVDSAGTTTKYYPGDTNVKAILNLYPDPASYVVVGTESMQNFRTSEQSIGNTNAHIGAGGNKDWFQTVAYFDLPTNMALGEATVTAVVDGNSASSTVEILAGTGVPQSFEGYPYTSTAPPLDRFQSFERSPFTSVVIRGPDQATVNTVQALDIKFTHDPDIDNGGQGRAHIANPRGDITSINWKDNGTLLHVVITPTNEQFVNTYSNIKFYITGGITGLAIQSITAVDINGTPVPGITALISPIIHSITQNTQTNSLEIRGDNFCNECIPSDVILQLRVNDTWSILTATSLSQSLITVPMPAVSPTDNASILVWAWGGKTSKTFQIQ